ncbi:hypothetical protein ABZ883_40675 [Streptomyces sp. NPDC046977]|uniref:hypothetical protein n=1 Tax=Streptomyces sp. NPDC046977 TaxID=3154703 RepID=UPI0033C32C04
MWGRLLGRDGPAAGDAAAGNAAAGERQSAPPPRGEWRGLVVQRSTFGAPALVSAPDAFKAGLSTWQNPSFSAGPLGHFVSEAAPGGVVHGVAEPVAPAQRATDLPVRQAVRVGPGAEAPAQVQRQVRPEAPAGRFTVARAVELPVRTLPAERASSDVPSVHVPEETVPAPEPAAVERPLVGERAPLTDPAPEAVSAPESAQVPASSVPAQASAPSVQRARPLGLGAPLSSVSAPEPAAVERPLVGERAPLTDPAPEAVSAPESAQVPASSVPGQASASFVQRARPLGLGAPLSSVPQAPPVQRHAAPDSAAPAPGSRPKLGRIGEPLTQVPVPPAPTTPPEAAPLAPLLGESAPLVQRQEADDSPVPRRMSPAGAPDRAATGGSALVQRVPAATDVPLAAVEAVPPARVPAPVVVMDVPPVRIQRLAGPEAAPEAPQPGPVAGLLGDRGLELRSVPTPSEPEPAADAPAALRVLPLVWSRPEGTVASGTTDGRPMPPVQRDAGDPPAPQAPRGGTPATARRVAAAPPRAERAHVQRSAAPPVGPASTTPVAEPFRTGRVPVPPGHPSVPVEPVPVPAPVQRFAEPLAGLPVVVPGVPVEPVPVQRSAGLPIVVPAGRPSVPVGPVPVPAPEQRHAEPSAGPPVVVPAAPVVPVPQRYAGQPKAAAGSPFAVQRLGAPSVAPLQRSAPGTVPGDPGSVAVAAGIAQRAADGSVVFAPPAPVPAVAQRETEAPLPSPAPTAAPITPPPAPAAAPSPEPPRAAESTDELVHRLLAPLSRLLRAELRLDRERAGLRLDSRH